MKTVKLGDVCKVVNGGTPKTGVPEYWDGDIFWITPKDLGRVKARTTEITERKITQSGLDNSSAKVIPLNSVILSTRAPIGHVAINTVPMAFNQGCRGLVPSGEILSEYLYYFLISSKKTLDELGTGTTFRELSAGSLKNIEVPLPSLREQQRVVERLDAAFEKIDRAIELTEKNIKNSWYLFDAFRKEKFAGGDITKKLGEVLVLQRGYDLPKSQRVAGEHPLVSSSGIIDNINEYKVQGPGICTGRSGSVGATFYVENNFWPLNTTLYVKDYLGNDPRYCYWLLYGLDLKQFAGGTGVPTLNRNIVHEHMVKMSQGESQKEIANTLDTEYLLCQDLSTKYQKKLSSLKLLKQSLLTQAFSQNEVK